MTISLSNHSPSTWPADGFDEDSYEEASPDEARLRGLTHQQLADRLTWLAWYQPGIFAAVMDYMEFSDALAADANSSDRDLTGEPGGARPTLRRGAAEATEWSPCLPRP